MTALIAAATAAAVSTGIAWTWTVIRLRRRRSAAFRARLLEVFLDPEQERDAGLNELDEVLHRIHDDTKDGAR